ncbi:unnamed protein product [Ambrosiozyma monospora]|uniref:CDP-diacylglycerol--glycerol-3-phosphate 3-phosphatidyltransferase n=1 Tax=Ambrosiozyma monospora TaxID=43982 RepID=A0A9W6Z8P0_AMBMO|nr:unnamed protein product [Ambrosiozyma monospora]
MFTASAFNCIKKQLLSPKSSFRLQAATMSFSNIAVDNSPLSNYSSFNPQLRATIQQLDAIAPRFEVNKGEIEILKSPSDFYSLLKQKISKAQDRIFLSSLYLGKTQDELVQCLHDSLTANPRVKVTILLDCLRSTRDAPYKSTASLLVPLVDKFGNQRVDIRFYHTPHLGGLSKRVIPKRINEGWGLQHMKIYGVDDEVILSGANLSEDYFTDRQDRYYVFKNSRLTNYYYTVQQAISSLSYQVLPFENQQKFVLEWPTNNKASEPHLNIHSFITDSTKLLLPILKSHMTPPLDADKQIKNPDTIVYPVSSFAPLMKPDYSTEKY